MLTSTYHDNYLDLIPIVPPDSEEIDKVLGSYKRAIEANVDNLLGGTVVVIDPGSVHAGYAIYRKGKLRDCGTITSQGRYPWQRLRSLHDSLKALPAKIDVLVIENIGAPNAKTVMPSYMKLLKGIGVFLGRLQYRYMVLCPVDLWRSFLKDPHEGKDDDRDAVVMGEAVMHVARSVRNSKKEAEKEDKDVS